MNHHSPIAAEGLPCIAVPAVFAVIALAFGWCISAVILCLLTLFVVWFFRNPERKIPENPKFIISPADGKVLRIEDVADHELLEGPLKKISIFMSVFNVHINRMPCDGVIENIRYHEGRFLSANLDKASQDNERNDVLIRMPDGRKALVIQIAGFIARRIDCWVAQGMCIQKGERFGLIRFGSRVEVFLPYDTHIMVSAGDKVMGGETPIGELP
ncbi:MAG: phosphatidylserine decarboxylase family protein [Syntrophobacterales bacterium CG_4_8_14_3_um_filter_58_8]|nr:MAG: phosphatidylserine decarboxylase family protein [Syntrophobacterales bacterium CG03_land_8_20_14_0_80_58_14]PJC71742.1 MAG: phosphatidylserine decarboxylase family protein [Syntrophobacterales bacterium CG_4_8_14_3_um_filter_58_8]